MLNKLLSASTNNPFITLVIFGVLVVSSIVALVNTPIDALPDLSENQVVVMTRWYAMTCMSS